ncbi:Mitochondrial enolase superfamily member 1-like [Homarus americanus]|uniref:Mitochondrial enolase superfamily member 1-like n=1 Tax=Homarus americanus TaxID=6706 RepID=A0A8J5JUP0_HOMAM|nr:Mitochondrial enolase superfamily member 1-like [Homarus americanus]
MAGNYFGRRPSKTATFLASEDGHDPQPQPGPSSGMTHNIYTATRIRGLSVRDIRFPTSLESDGSDAIHPDPDYSCTYVILYTDTDFKGHGISFTIGRGNELVVEAVKSLSHLVVGKDLKDIYEDFAGTWRALTSESQLRWVGPEKGVIHLAVAAIVNALWDLWARTEHKPLWKLLVDMEPEKLVSTIDFRYIWMKELAPYKPLWIEEPTSPDDVLGHAKIAEALKPLGIGVASGEMCQNRVIFKQMLQAGALNYCQIDACRVGGVNEVLAIYLMAKKFNVPVCPHAGGVGLCEMVQHLQIWDYISVSGTTKDRIIEYVDHLIEHFKTPRKINHCHYLAPKVPGYSVEMWEKSLLDYEFPYGAKWNALFDEGRYKDPRKGPPPWVEHRVKGDIIHR